MATIIFHSKIKQFAIRHFFIFFLSILLLAALLAYILLAFFANLLALAIASRRLIRLMDSFK